ncbi:hypothetical protein BDV93DRAFT_396469, partial [Ceratobasidium sp. AG-I]
PTMAQSLRSLERRLGLNTDELIITFTLCQKCGTRYSPEQINNARNPGCSRYWNGLRCDNPLYDESTLYDGVLKRTPRKSFPYVSIIRLIERLLMRPGMKELMQHWRRNDNPVDNEPLSKDDWLETKGPQEIFGDISQAWGWRAEPVGLTRRWDAENNSYGDTVDDDGPISLASRPLGLSLSLNHDGRVNLHVFIAYISLYLWRRFQSFSNGKYSVDGVYVVINNLPFYLRHLIENTMLVIVIPGPNGPTDFEFDQIMEPLVDDILRLEQDLLVHNMELNRPEEQLVHAHLSVGVLDYIARMKTCGHAGTASERNFCLYCKTKRSFIVAREGYNNLALRDPVEVLDQKHAWLRTPTERRERMRKQTGVTFTEFDRLPGWYAAGNCPIDAMHLFHLGTTRHIVREIVVKPGLLNPRAGQPLEDQPFTRFDKLLARTVWPTFCLRKPPPIENMTGKIKADQWHHLSIILPVALFEALRKAHRHRGGDPEDAPTFESCASVRSPRLIYRNILGYCDSLHNFLRHNTTRDRISRGQRSMAHVATQFALMNLPLTPNFHYTMHVEESMLKFGSLYGFWAFPFERANRLLININNNGHTLGALETTMARGFLK